MASLVTTVVDGWYDVMENRSDPRVKDWFMMSSPFPTIFISLFYAYFVTKLGPKLMENRKPYNLKNIMLVYNFAQVLLSIYLFHEGMASGWLGKYSFACQPVDYSNSPDGIRMAQACYAYYISKFIELTDTIFFVIRKKNNQISTLHVIHHGIMPVSVWFGVKFTAGGHATFFGLLNTFVHIWMYLYYFLAALGPKVQPYLWWKKHLTTLQMIQFVIVLIHEAQLLFMECNYPKAIVWWIALHALLFFFLFKDFYNKAYNQKKGKESDVNVAGIEVDPHREGIKQSDLWAKNYEHLANNRRANVAYKQKEGKESEVDVAGIEVDPHREGIKQSDLWAKNYEHLTNKRRANEATNNQTPLCADQYKMATGYISDEGLRNRVFIDNNRSVDE